MELEAQIVLNGAGRPACLRKRGLRPASVLTAAATGHQVLGELLLLFARLPHLARDPHDPRPYLARGKRLHTGHPWPSCDRWSAVMRLFRDRHTRFSRRSGSLCSAT